MNKVVSAGKHYEGHHFFFSSTIELQQLKCISSSGLSRRCRRMQPDNSPFELVPATLNIYSDSITADIVNKENGHLFVLKLEGVKVRILNRVPKNIENFIL